MELAAATVARSPRGPILDSPPEEEWIRSAQATEAGNLSGRVECAVGPSRPPPVSVMSPLDSEGHSAN